mmetsp:Transcript_14495/g.16613  ORF Transcript_14495/g.16613 Transcript_14495/m.16613 type:complete len:318 (-) Transcript_14495:58-1011(-)
MKFATSASSSSKTLLPVGVEALAVQVDHHRSSRHQHQQQYQPQHQQRPDLSLLMKIVEGESFQVQSQGTADIFNNNNDYATNTTTTTTTIRQNTVVVDDDQKLVEDLQQQHVQMQKKMMMMQPQEKQLEQHQEQWNMTIIPSATTKVIEVSPSASVSSTQRRRRTNGDFFTTLLKGILLRFSSVNTDLNQHLQKQQQQLQQLQQKKSSSSIIGITKSKQKRRTLISIAPLTTFSDSTCANRLIKAYSVDHLFHKCAETCMKEQDFFGFKIPFEPGLQKATAAVPNPCQVAGYAIFVGVETHQPCPIIHSTMNMYTYG